MRSLVIGRAVMKVVPTEVESERVLASIEKCHWVAGTPDRAFSSYKQGRTDPASRARRRDIQRCNAVLVYLDPADHTLFYRDPHLMLSNRSHNPIRGRLRGPCFGLRDRQCWHSQREDGTPPNSGEHLLVDACGTSNLQHLVSPYDRMDCAWPAPQSSFEMKFKLILGDTAAYRVVPCRRNSFDLGVRMAWRGNRRLQPRGGSAGQAECLAVLHVIVYICAMQRTIRLQLQPSPAQAQQLVETCRQFTTVFNAVCAHGWCARISHGVKLHHATYYPLRADYPNLVSDLHIQARIGYPLGAVRVGCPLGDASCRVYATVVDSPPSAVR